MTFRHPLPIAVAVGLSAVIVGDFVTTERVSTIAAMLIAYAVFFYLRTGGKSDQDYSQA